MFNKLRRRFAPKNNRHSSGLHSVSRQSRRTRVENLEPRHLLTGGLTLGSVPNQTLNAGAPLQIPLNAVDTNGSPVTFSVSSSNPAISTSLPTTNPDMVLTISHTSSGAAGDSSFSGQMTIELFQNLVPNTVNNFINLVNQGVYTNTSFYRIVQNFVIQAGQGNNPTVNVPTIDDEFNSVLRYSSAGVVGLARQNADDTGTSEFFISQGGPQEFLDYQYAIFGRLASDPNDLLDKIASIPVNSSSAPTKPVTITSASITHDTNDLALQISAPVGTTGTGTITVNVSDGHGGTDQKTFNVTVQADTTNPGPFLETLPTSPFLQGLATPPTTTVNTPLTFQLPTFDLNGDQLTFYNQTDLKNNFNLTPTQAIDANLNVSVDPTTGVVTVTPSNGLVGETPMFFGVSSSHASSPQNNEPNTQMVPLFINPAAPTSITLEAGSDTGSSSSDDITSLNNSAGHTLSFDVTGLMSPGSTILLFDGSQQIGSATYTGSTTATATVVVTTDGSHVLSDGSHQITAEQILPAQAYTVGNSSGNFTPTSALSGAVNLTIDAAGPTFTSVPPTSAQVGIAYNYTAQATDLVASGLTYSLINGPTGMSIDASSGVVTWTPTSAQVGSQSVQIRATDVAGSTQDQTFSVVVSLGPPITSVSSPSAANSAFDAGSNVSITITFASAVSVTGTPLLALNNGGTASYASGSGTDTLTFSYTVASGQDTAKLDYASTTALSLNGGTIEDAVNNPAGLTLPATGTDGLAALDLIVDTVQPTVTVTPTTTNNPTPTITGTVNDASPTSGIASVVVVVNGQTINATVNGTNWSAMVPGSLSDGTYDVQATATDRAGNQNVITATGALIVDTVSPNVTDVTTTAAANSTFNVGQSVTINVTFSENVFVTGTPTLTLNNGGTATFSSGSGSAILSFVYTVAPAQSTSDLDYASVNALVLGTATIDDAAGNAAVLTLPTPGTDNLAAANITINAPAIVSDVQVTIAPLSATAMAGGSVGFTITITNLGPNAATGITLTDTLPATVAFGSQRQTSGPTISLSNSGNVITDTLSSLASGASATLFVTADVNITTAAGAVISDTASVASTSLDTILGNNTATASTSVIATNVMLATDPFDSTKMELLVNGTVGNDNISFLPAAGGKISVNMNGKMFGPFAVTSRLIARGGAGNDVITVSPLITLPAFLYSGTGIDKLNGGGGQNVLVGGGGTVTMIGGPTRNVLIAGAGKATIYSSKLGVPVGANSGSLMIAGSTSFDQTDAALSAIMHEWGSSDAYATRISKIRNGQIGAGVTMSAATVHPTAHVVDQLYASPGGYDWFLNFGLTSQMLGIDPHKKSLIQIN